MTGKFKLRRSRDQKYYWNLHAENGEPILNSETYESKYNALVGIESCRKSVADSNFVKANASNGQYYFVQRANNYEPIGKSEMYATTQGRDNGIEAVKRCAPHAIVEDLTQYVNV